MNRSVEISNVTWVLQMRAYPRPDLIWRKGGKDLTKI